MNVNEQLNMQILDREKILAPLQKLNLLDDFLFDAAMVDLETCRIVLELSMGIKIQKLSWKEGQKVIHNLPGQRGIRMDFYAEDEQGKVFDVEMQKRNAGNIPKRTRFYQALMDTPLLKSGEQGFDSLNPTVIIVICGFDLYGYQKYRYTFESRCEEVPGLIMGDECKKIILNTKGTNDSEEDQSLIDFLHYVERSKEESISENCDERLKNLHKKVLEIKASVQMGVEYMKQEEREWFIKEEGIKEGEKAGEERILKLIAALIQKGRQAELSKVAEDTAYREELFREFKI